VDGPARGLGEAVGLSTEKGRSVAVGSEKSGTSAYCLRSSEEGVIDQDLRLGNEDDGDDPSD
jgi:hypothetical protein